jgi:hypothetical protein
MMINRPRQLATHALLSLMACATTAALAQAPANNAASREQFRKDNAARAEAPLPPELLAIAARVVTGRIPCELGHNVALLPDPAAPGYFVITTGKERFRLQPVTTTTGAIRLEDKVRGGVWLQLANKSMLLDEKNGRRLADACVNPAQQAVADAMKAAPPTSVLGVLPGTVPNAEPLPQPPETTVASDTPSQPATTSPAPLNLSLPTR